MPATVGIDQIVIPAMRKYCLKQTQFLVEDRGLFLDDWSFHMLQRAVAAALQRARLKLHDVEVGRTDPAEFSGTLSALRSHGQEDKSITFSEGSNAENALGSLVDRWWKEAEVAGRAISTFEKYNNTLKSFSAFVGHDDLSRISSKDVVAYKGYRLSNISAKTGRAPSAKTVKDSNLAALKTIFGSTVINQLMPAIQRLVFPIKLGKRPRLRLTCPRTLIQP